MSLQHNRRHMHPAARPDTVAVTMTTAVDDGNSNNAGASNPFAIDPNDIAKCALHHYQHTLSRGKPRDDDEWTIYSAIVAATMQPHTCTATVQPHTCTAATHSFHVVTCATGTKCTTKGPDGWVLRDCHAEVLCKRGLVRELLQEVHRHHHRGCSNQSHHLLEKCNTKHNKDDPSYRLRSDTTLHLYVSTSPCGDATIYPILNEMNFTGAKAIVGKNTDSNDNRGSVGKFLPVSSTGNWCDRDSTDCFVAREDTQQLGALRTKSGRSNLPQRLRSTSMSCSDKLVRWCVLGLQGSWLPFDIRLSSIVVSRDRNSTSLGAQQHALERAINHRINQVVKELQSRREIQSDFVKRVARHDLSVHVVEEQFPGSKTNPTLEEQSVSTIGGSSKKRKRNDDGNKALLEHESKEDTKETPSNKKCSPCGVSINWQVSNGETELVVGARGMRQGKKPRSLQDYVTMASRLSRGALVHLVRTMTMTTIGEHVHTDAHSCTKMNATTPPCRQAEQGKTDAVTTTAATTSSTTATTMPYRDFKGQQCRSDYMESRQLVLSTRPFQGWLVGTSDFEA